MMRWFVNGLAASAGGGLTYLRNVIPHLGRRADAETTVLVSEALRGPLEEVAAGANLSLVYAPHSEGALRRGWWEQRALPGMIRASGAQVLISTGNFALWNSPVPQILLSRNALYTSADFLRDVRARRDRALWADTLLKGWLAKRSIGRAEVTVAPSAAFAEELRQWTGRDVRTVHHGFDADAFGGGAAALPVEAQRELERSGDALRLLFVSHYNYYRNFETLFRALPQLSERLKGEGKGDGKRKVKLFLTCRLSSAENPGRYRAEAAAALASELRAQGTIVELGMIPYGSLHHLYRACDIYVTPSYAESFAHPLLEAMSSGLPVVASDLPVHREICGGAGSYFARFSPEELAQRVGEIHMSPAMAARLRENGLRRARDFSWSAHVEGLATLARGLLRGSGSGSTDL